MGSKLFINGKIWKTDSVFDESFGVRTNRFSFNGRNSDAKKIQDEYDEIIDLEGKTVLPGLFDSHVHLVYGSILKKQLDCRNISSFDELRKTIEHRIANRKNKDEWIIGANLNINRLNIEPQGSNLLDTINSDIPIYISNYDYHSALANKQALGKSGLSDRISQFSDEEIPKLKNGEPTGIIKERAMQYVFDNLPGVSVVNKANAVYDFIKTMHSYGITSICDITLPDNLEVYNYLAKEEKLNIRVNSYLPIMESDKINEFLDSVKNIDTEFFNIKGFKIFYDGSLGSQSGYFKENYLNRNTNGIKTDMAKSGKLPELFRKLDAKGWQLITHAIGDKAVDETLSLYEELVKYKGSRDRRARIEHAQHIDENDFPRFRQSDIIISAQPIHLKYDAELVRKTLPGILVNRTHNYGKLIDSGVKICFGTDFPIVEINPFENIQEAMTRETNIGVFTPENKIDLNNCIKCYTMNGAYASFNDELGLIDSGKKADFVILNKDIFSVPENEIQTIKAEETFINGEKVFSIYD